MPMNFDAAVAAAKSAVEGNNQGNAVEYKYPLVYPQKGSSMVIRPLFNPKSGQIVRLINRHERIACYRTYHEECPVCKLIQDIKDQSGQDIGRTYGSRSRGICYAQFVSSTVPIKKGKDGSSEVKNGDIILCMFPWSVYQAINEQIQVISQSPTGMEQAFSKPDQGLYLQINVTNDFTYSVVTVPYASFPITNPDGTQMNEEHFFTYLESFDNLNDQVLPAELTDEIREQVDTYVDELKKKFLAGATAPATPIQNPQPQVATQIVQPTAPVPQANNIIPEAVPGAPVPTVTNTPPQTPSVVQTATPTTTATEAVATEQPTNRPSCFGCYNETEPKCMVCAEDLLCKEQSDDIPF